MQRRLTAYIINTTEQNNYLSDDNNNAMTSTVQNKLSSLALTAVRTSTE